MYMNGEFVVMQKTALQCRNDITPNVKEKDNLLGSRGTQEKYGCIF